MVQSVQTPNGVQQIQGVGFGQQGNTYFITKPYENDSFNGKTLLTLGATALGLLYFRRSIGGFLKNMFPNLSILGKNAMTKMKKPFQEFVKQNAKNPIIENSQKAKGYLNKFLDWFCYKSDAAEKAAEKLSQATTNNTTGTLITGML